LRIACHLVDDGLAFGVELRGLRVVVLQPHNFRARRSGPNPRRWAACPCIRPRWRGSALRSGGAVLHLREYLDVHLVQGRLSIGWNPSAHGAKGRYVFSGYVIFRRREEIDARCQRDVRIETAPTASVACSGGNLEGLPPRLPAVKMPSFRPPAAHLCVWQQIGSKPSPEA
jgi:hypothetical protein